MNLGNYFPSQPLDDRRRKGFAPPDAAHYDPQYNWEVPPASLLQLLAPNSAVEMSRNAPAGGMANVLGYNLIGREPMPRGPDTMLQDPLSSAATQELYRQRLIGGTGGAVPYLNSPIYY